MKWILCLLLLCGCGRAPKPNIRDSVLVGWMDWPFNCTNCIAVGRNAQAQGISRIALGNDTTCTNDYSIVVRFTDGTEWRSDLPHKRIDCGGVLETNK